MIELSSKTEATIEDVQIVQVNEAPASEIIIESEVELGNQADDEDNDD